ncbi:MAG TPA: ABC transporter permease [Gemmatimonadaceae bacterium]|nr:ABC transporter permease [Gemmatimonadaceae bacterium]
MLRLLGARALHAAGILLAVATLTFALVRLSPGNACGNPGDFRLNPAAQRACLRRLHLDRPIPAQYALYLRNLARLDLGESFATGEPVTARLARALPNTILLMGLSLVASFVLGIAVALLQSYSPSAGHPLAWLLIIGYSLPDFWVAQLALLVFAYALPIFPPGGVTSFGAQYLAAPAAALDHLRHLWLPCLTLTAVSTAGVARFQHAALRNVRHEDWIRTARAKGVGERTILLRHALRNALGPVITLFGASLPAVVGGAVFVEKVFAWPGVGALAVDAVSERDIPVVVACVVLGAAAVVIGSTVADVLSALADPRQRAAT